MNEILSAEERRERCTCGRHVRCACECGRSSRWHHSEDTRCAYCQFEDLAKSAPRRMRLWNDETYRAWDGYGVEQRRAEKEAREWWADHLDGAMANLYLYGPSGTGKSGLAWCIARADWAENGTPRWLNVRQYLRELQASYRREPDERLDPADDLYGASAPDFLVLDDVGAERATPWALEELGRLVEYRYDESLGPTVVTSNYSPPELARHLGREDPIVGDRIVSRLLEGATTIHLGGPNRRYADA